MNHYRVECACPSKEGTRTNYLGDIHLSNPYPTRHHCKSCNTTWEHRVIDGVIHRTIVVNKIEYTENPIRVDYALSNKTK
jgi:hypothetical protein